MALQSPQDSSCESQPVPSAVVTERNSQKFGSGTNFSSHVELCCNVNPSAAVEIDQKISQNISICVDQSLVTNNNNNFNEEDTDEDPFQDSGSSFHPSNGSEDESQSETYHDEEDQNGTVDNQLKKKRVKKGQRNPTTWKRNSAQIRRRKGEEYEAQKKNTETDRKQLLKEVHGS